MKELDAATGRADIDDALRWFLLEARPLLGAELVGIYLVGSLALGDFDPATSDVDVIVVTAAALAPTTIDALRDMHARFDRRASAWVGRIEAVYVEPNALRTFPPGPAAYPQVEKGRGLFVEPLEVGWIFQCWTLREHGVVLAGPAPSELVPALDPDDMHRAAAPVALMWQRAVRGDPTWLPWLRERPNQSFVVLTLCRLLYTLDSARVASKPAAARWAQHCLGEQWSTLIARALVGGHASDQIDPGEEQQTLALLDYTLECFRTRLASAG